MSDRIPLLGMLPLCAALLALPLLVLAPTISGSIELHTHGDGLHGHHRDPGHRTASSHDHGHSHGRRHFHGPADASSPAKPAQSEDSENPRGVVLVLRPGFVGLPPAPADPIPLGAHRSFPAAPLVLADGPRALPSSDRRASGPAPPRSGSEAVLRANHALLL